MAAQIPVTSRRGVQAVALAFAGALLVSAYLFATTGWGTPFPGCWPSLARPPALTVAAVQVALAVGFVAAALRRLSGPAPTDPLLLTMVLMLFSALALGGAVYTFATGVARWGKSGCLAVGGPWSYGFGTIGLVAGGVALFAAVALAKGGHASD